MNTNSARRSQAGVALVEFALVTPLLMMVLLGLVEIGRLTYFTIEVGNAAHAGAEYGSLSAANALNSTGITSAVRADGQNSISSLTVSSNYVCGCWNGTAETPSTPTHAACLVTCTAGRLTAYSQVTVTATMSPLFNYGALGLPSSWTVTRIATVRIAPR